MFKGGPGLSQPYKELPIVDRPLQRIAIDITDMHSGQEGYRYSLTVIDHFSRFTRLYPLRNKMASTVIARLDEYVADYGSPEAILLDNAAEFSGHEMRQWSQRNGVVLHYTTPFHPQANGLCERVHRTIKTVLAQLCRGHPHRWPSLLNQCQRALNSSVHTSTSTTPYMAFFNRPPMRGPESQFPLVRNPDCDYHKLKEMIKSASIKSQRQYRAYANRRKRRESVGKGALVWVKREAPIPGTATKLNSKWLGPFKVVEVLQGGSMYIVENPYDGARKQRAAEKIRPYVSETNLIHEIEEMDEVTTEEPNKSEAELPPRRRQPPRRLIEQL